MMEKIPEDTNSVGKKEQDKTFSSVANKRKQF